MSQVTPDVTVDVSDTIRTNYVAFASLTILVWDHLATFSDEVEFIWKGKKGPIIYLFLFNRYFTPLGFVVNLFAYLSPVWTVERFVISIACVDCHRSVSIRCKHFVRYEGTTVALAVEVVGLMMLLRVNALYPRGPWIARLLGALLAVETGINIWLISRGEPVVHNVSSGVHACSMVFNPEISHAASASAWYPLMYDSIVFGLTVNRTLPSIRRKQAGYIVKKLLEDGLLYYSVIFSITFVLTFMIVGAPPGTKNICAQMEQLITVAMMSRITLSLKKAGRKGEIGPGPLFFDGRDPDFFYTDTFSHSVVHATEDLSPPLPKATSGIRLPERLVLQGPSAIRFVAPSSPQPSQLSDVLEFPTHIYPPPSSLRHQFS